MRISEERDPENGVFNTQPDPCPHAPFFTEMAEIRGRIYLLRLENKSGLFFTIVRSLSPRPEDPNMRCKQAVALLPGFLGFERIGQFYYFADRVEAALRSALLALAPNRSMPVIPVPTLPTAHLHERQSSLLTTLGRIDEALGGVERLHLVGHSTGGVDAYLLTGARPLDRSRKWQDLDPTGLRQKIHTVVSIASPHHGTGLALSPLARFFRQPIEHLGDATTFAEAVLLLASSTKLDSMAWDAVIAAVADSGAAGKYVFDVLRARKLTEDLRPGNLAEVHRRFRRGLPQARIRSIVTMAAEATNYYVNASGVKGLRKPDRFFRFLYEQTALGDASDDARRKRKLQRTLGRLRNAVANSTHVIHNPNAELQTIDRALNDGFVNSARQLARPNDDDELWAVVVADHLDVIGHYPRWLTPEGKSPLQRRVSLHTGVLHSGSGFGDEEFFRLYLRVAEAILET